jgi:ketosteroid isomerase-like protein
LEARVQTGTVSDRVREYFSAYQSGDRKLVERLLSDDFTFTSPVDDHIDKATYFERCWPNSQSIESHDIEKLFDRDNEVFVRYLLHKKDGKKFRNTEFFSFEGDKIKSVEVYFGSDV